MISTLSKLEKLAAEAKPISEDDWGSERQVDAQNAFGDALELILDADTWKTFEVFALKATSEEMIEFGLACARDADPLEHRHRCPNCDTVFACPLPATCVNHEWTCAECVGMRGDDR